MRVKGTMRGVPKISAQFEMWGATEMAKQSLKPTAGSALANLPSKLNKPRPLPAAFKGAAMSTISRDEIYHRLEWYFHASHDPHGPHVIPPAAPIGPFLKNLTLADLYININKQSSTYVPAWNSALFNGVQFPWDSVPGVFTGIRDLKTFGDLINCAVASYNHFGWQVT
jgi:hypothetical protein